jgi:hypothetical protein
MAFFLTFVTVYGKRVFEHVACQANLFFFQKYWPAIFVSSVFDQIAGNISDNCPVKAKRDSQLTVTKVRESVTPFICRYWGSANVQQMADVLLYLEPR